jgi:hypothetical protein
MTIVQLRTALEYMERNYELALDAGDQSLADAFNDKIQILLNQLIALVQDEDPYASEADIRYWR